MHTQPHRHIAAQAELLDAPAIALRLMVAHALTGSDLWSVRAHRDAVGKETTAASLAAAPGQSKLAEACDDAKSLFAALETVMPGQGFNGSNLCETFSALLAMTDEEVMRVLTFRMATTIESGGAVVEALLHVLDVDLAKHWAPDEAFFELLRDKKVINEMLGQISGPQLANSMLTDTGKAQKEAIVSRINGEGCKANREWRPGWMQVPPRPVLEGYHSAPVDHWDSVAAIFEGDASNEKTTDNQSEQSEAA